MKASLIAMAIAALLHLAFAASDNLPFPLHESPARGRCGAQFSAACADGLCCSAAGYCGRGHDFCGVPGYCQELYGWCDSYKTPPGTDIQQGNRKYNDRIPSEIKQCTRPKTLALSFDDGPASHTIEVLDVLKEFNAHATFFLGGMINGRGALDSPEWRPVVKRIFDEGHQIGSHTWSHPDLDTLSAENRKIEIYKTEQAIFNVIGKKPTFLRAPYIKCGSECQKDMRALGYHVASWQYDSGDWREKQEPVATTVARLISDIENNKEGSMLLIQHDTRKTASIITRGLLKYLDGSDWKATTLVECVGGFMADAYQ